MSYQILHNHRVHGRRVLKNLTIVHRGEGEGDGLTSFENMLTKFVKVPIYNTVTIYY